MELLAFGGRVIQAHPVHRHFSSAWAVQLFAVFCLAVVAGGDRTSQRRARGVLGTSPIVNQNPGASKQSPTGVPDSSVRATIVAAPGPATSNLEHFTQTYSSVGSFRGATGGGPTFSKHIRAAGAASEANSNAFTGDTTSDLHGVNHEDGGALNTAGLGDSASGANEGNGVADLKFNRDDQAARNATIAKALDMLLKSDIAEDVIRAATTAKGMVIRAGRQKHRVNVQAPGRVRNQTRAATPQVGHWIIVSPSSQAMPSRAQQDEVSKAEEELSTSTGTVRELVEAVAGGTGAAIGGTGNAMLDKNLARRMRLQDEVVMMLMLLLYFTSLAFSAGMVYRQAANDSPVTFYAAGPGAFSATAHGHDVNDFLEAFNHAPKGAYLRVTGYRHATEFSQGAVRWKGEYFIVDFTFSLDLSVWVVRGAGTGSTEDGMPAEDIDLLRRWLRENNNDLATVQLKRLISWHNWEELATNIKHIIRQRGFDGIVDIDCAKEEGVTIYKNTHWANFMHKSTLKVIMVLSVVGWVLYVPYMWLRCSKLVVRSSHRVNIDIGDYWELISESLGAGGFDGPSDWLPDLNAFTAQAPTGNRMVQEDVWDPVMTESEADGEGRDELDSPQRAQLRVYQ